MMAEKHYGIVRIPKPKQVKTWKKNESGNEMQNLQDSDGTLQL